MKLKKTHYYDGSPYAYGIDPLLKPIRKALAGLVEPGAAAVDIGCGAGALAMELSRRCSKVVGIDWSEAMIRHARRIRAQRGIGNLSLICADALQVLDDLRDHRFDYAVFSMILHETTPESRIELIVKAGRIARHVLFADYRIPLRPPLSVPILIVERIAGREHFQNFMNFSRHGGLLPIIEAAGLTAPLRQTICGGAVCIMKTRALDSEHAVQIAPKGG